MDKTSPSIRNNFHGISQSLMKPLSTENLTQCPKVKAAQIHHMCSRERPKSNQDLYIFSTERGWQPDYKNSLKGLFVYAFI